MISSSNFLHLLERVDKFYFSNEHVQKRYMPLKFKHTEMRDIIGKVTDFFTEYSCAKHRLNLSSEKKNQSGKMNKVMISKL